MSDFTKDTSRLTPIEVLLQVDEDGTVSSKNVYVFLELNPSNYAKWCKTNIVENKFAEENVDYTPFVLNDERNPNPTTDYKLTVTFAKKLCMLQKNERGEEARNYFVKVEDKLKQVAMEAENAANSININDPAITNAVTKYVMEIRRIMEKQGCSPREIAIAIAGIFRRAKLPVPPNFIIAEEKIAPTYIQSSLITA